MSNSQTSRPFPPDHAIPPTRGEIIADGVARLRQQHMANVDAYRTEFEAEAESAWVEHLAKQKADFIAQYRETNYMKPKYAYRGYSQSAQYRISLEPPQRLQGLAEVGLLDEFIKVMMVRNHTRTVSIQTVTDWVAPYLDEVNGEYGIVLDSSDRLFPENVYVTDELAEGDTVVVHARGLSKSFAEILVVAFDVRNNQVVWHAPQDLDESEY